MDYQYQLSVNTDTISIKNVILLYSSEAAKLYLDKIYDHYTDVIVYSVDEIYPTDNKLRIRTRAALEQDTNLNIIILGCNSLGSIKLASSKILILDDLIMSDAVTSKRKPSMGLDEKKIALMIRSFVDQDKKIKMGNNFADGYSNFKEYTVRTWLQDLLI
jgi:hypothetical protein